MAGGKPQRQPDKEKNPLKGGFFVIIVFKAGLAGKAVAVFKIA
ncbi:MAG: Hypothetical protein BHV28_04370 [Candidatus Tokpelaia hoelldobleri]|uniref:Uncharacterized protein n=1 Tax=Candidatus Tokpelaia hoelldobleri TaxID=1902579 RepID=A0A1U9JTG1_9HYPH|nr:MAG: Hypothetical protein BHV28_04370 [Candidatus Tokpelaia hoelldoblerii]